MQESLRPTPQPRAWMRPLRWVGLILLLALTLVVNLSPFLLGVQQESAQDVFDTTTPLWYVVPGLVVMAKRPWHIVGWLLILTGLGLALVEGPGELATIDPRWYPWLAWVFDGWGGYFDYLVVVSLLVVFPDGLGARSPKGRLLGRALIWVMTGLVLLAATSEPVGGGEGSLYRAYSNPLGLSVVPREAAEYGYLLVFAIILFAVAWMWRRQRRELGVVRRRYTLVLYSFALLALALIVGAVLSELVSDNAWLPAYLLWLWLPIAFSIAVIRHGLYGLDRIVSRTVTYALVAAVVALVYVLPVLFLPVVLGESDLVTAGATLMAAAVFNPARRRIQRAVDRRFNRSKYDRERELEEFAVRLRSHVELDVLTQDLLRVVERTVQPLSASLWIAQPPVTARRVIG